MLSHFGLDHVGLDGAAVGQPVVLWGGAAPPVLQVQEGVGGLGALWSLANAGQGVRPHVSVGGSELPVTTRAKEVVVGGGGLQTSAGKQDGRGRRGQELQPIPPFRNLNVTNGASPWGVRHRRRRGDVQVQNSRFLLFG